MDKRNSNIELLRILSMFFIVVGHFTSQSGVKFDELSMNNMVLFLMSYGLRIACNVFLLIGVWYLVDSDFKARRITSIYGQLIYYVWPLTILSVILFKGTYSFKAIAKGVFPFGLRAFWFASAYITLLLVAPFLRKIIQWKRNTLRILVVLTLVFISGVSTLPETQDGYVIDTVWFAVVYLMVGYIKKSKVKFPNKRICFLLSGGGYCLLTMMLYFSKIFNESTLLAKLGGLCSRYLLDLKTIPNIAISLFLFIGFIQMREKHNGAINRVASIAFSVYLFHQVPAFYPGLWRTVFRAEEWIERPYFWYPIVIFVSIYVFVAAVDFVRIKIFEPRWINNKMVRKCESRIDSLYRNL